MHKVTDFYSLKGGSEDAISSPKDISFPVLAAVSNFYYGQSLCPTYPVGAFDPEDFPPTIPCDPTGGPGTSNVDDYDSWFMLGNYIIVTNAQLDGEPAKVDGLLAWSAPNRPDVWALEELDDDTGEDVKTGAGSAQLAGGPHIEFALGAGATGHVFSSDEIGLIGLSDRWYDPFTYILISDSIGPASKPLLFNRVVWIVLNDGRFYKIQGTQMQIASDFFDAYAPRNRFDSPGIATKLGQASLNFVLDTTTEQVWINRTTGGYGCSGGANPFITTGVLQIVPPHHRTHLIGIKVRHSWTAQEGVDFMLKAITWGTAEFGAYEPEQDSVVVNVTNADETIIPVNRMLHDPQVKIVIPDGQEPDSLVIYGLSFIYEDGGPRSY